MSEDERLGKSGAEGDRESANRPCEASIYHGAVAPPPAKPLRKKLPIVLALLPFMALIPVFAGGDPPAEEDGAKRAESARHILPGDKRFGVFRPVAAAAPVLQPTADGAAAEGEAAESDSAATETTTEKPEAVPAPAGNDAAEEEGAPGDDAPGDDVAADDAAEEDDAPGDDAPGDDATDEE